MIRPDEDQFLDQLSDQIFATNANRISRSEIVSAGIDALRELHRLQGQSASFLPFTMAKSGSDLSMLVVVGIRGAVDAGVIAK